MTHRENMDILKVFSIFLNMYNLDIFIGVRTAVYS